MRTFAACLFFLSGFAITLDATASTAVKPSGYEEALAPWAGGSDGSAVTLVSGQGPLYRAQTAQHPLSGSRGWVVAGAIGALVPLILFALPAVWFAWFGPFAPFAFVVAVVVATLTTAGGGALAWGVSSAYSDMNSDIVMPVVASALVGMGATFVAGIVASTVIVLGLTMAWLARPDPNFGTGPSDWRSTWYGPHAPMALGATMLAFGIWTTGVLIAAIGGPMTAAYVFQQYGTMKRD